MTVRGKVGDLASIYSLNDVATTIWQALEEPKSVADLVRTIASEYEVAAQQAEQDVLFFLGEMVSSGLVISRSSVSEQADHNTARIAV